MTFKVPMQLILASSSPSRRALLERLSIPFVSISPDVDESILPGEAASDLVMRLARAKAAKVVKLLENQNQNQNDPVKDYVVKDHIVIAADQVASLGDKIFTKPLNLEKAKADLMLMSGQLVTFFTGVCVIHQQTGSRQEVLSPYQVCFRDLAPATIDAYLAKERPLGCAGSFKSEGLGIALVKYFKGDDPTSLIGLPLTHLCSMLTSQGILFVNGF